MHGGPPPGRSNERLGHRSAEELAVTTLRYATNEPIEPMPPNPNWHPIAKWWYDQFRKSGQRSLYEFTDWAMITLAADQISRELDPDKIIGTTIHGEVIRGEKPMAAAMLNTVTRIAASVMATEGDRRRQKLELTRGYADPGEDEVAERRRRHEERRARLSG